MEQLWNRNYVGVMLANFLMYFAFYLLTPLLPIYLAETFAAPKDTIGLVLSGYVVAALVIRPLSGFVIDSFDRRRVFLLCLATFAVCFAGYVAAGSLLMFAIVRTLHGAPFGAVTVANSTVAIDVLPSSRRNEGLGYFGLSNNLAMAIAPSAGIAIYHLQGNFELLFWLALGVAAAGWLAGARVTLPARQLRQGKLRLSLDRFFLTRAWLMAINIALFGFCWGTMSNYVAIYSRDVLGITGGTGTFFALLSTGLFLSRLQGAKALREGKLTRNAGEGMLLSLCGFVIFVAIPHPAAYYGSAMLIGLGNGHMYPAFLNMFIASAHHNERGTANSSILTGWDAGFGLGVLAGGVVAEHLGYQATFAMVAMVNATGVALFFLATRRFFLRVRLHG